MVPNENRAHVLEESVSEPYFYRSSRFNLNPPRRGKVTPGSRKVIRVGQNCSVSVRYLQIRLPEQNSQPLRNFNGGNNFPRLALRHTANE